MKKLTLLIPTLFSLLSACTTTPLMPTDISLKNSRDRHLDDTAGGSPQETATKCAYNMVNASPSPTGATQIRYHIIGVNNPLVIDIDAALVDVGQFGGSVPVTYRCEYSQGKLISTKWTSGLK